MRGQATTIQAVSTPRLTDRLVSRVIDELDFSGMVEVEASYAKKGGHCACESICRCQVIAETEISLSDDQLAVVSEAFSNKQFRELFLKNREEDDQRAVAYALERTLTRGNFSEEDFFVLTSSGYYGDEVEAVHMSGASSQGAKDLHETIKLLRQPASKIVKSMLTKEYGHLLPRLKNKSFKAKQVSLDQLILGSSAHASRLSAEQVGFYRARDAYRQSPSPSRADAQIPKAVVEPRASGFAVLDGYHRIGAASRAGKKNAWVWVAE